MQKTNRKAYFDFLRIIACFLVIFNHTSGYTAYQSAQSGIQTFFYMFFTMVTRINVPIFFMISGALLLSKDVTYKDIFLKRILRIAAALLCASLVIYLLKNRHNFSALDPIDFLRKLLSEKHATSYWYLYAYLGLLISLPLMRSIAKNFRHADFFTLLIVHFFLSTFMPLFNYIINYMGIEKVKIGSDFQVPLMTVKAFFYPLLGYYLDRVFDINKLNRKNVWLLPAIALIGIFASSLVTYHEGIHYKFSQNYVQTFDYVTAICTFLLVKYLFVKCPPIVNCSFLNKAIVLIGSLTFGVYLIEPALKVYIHYFNDVVTIANPLVYSFVWCIFSMTVGSSITYMLKKIPLVKQVL